MNSRFVAVLKTGTPHPIRCVAVPSTRKSRAGVNTLIQGWKKMGKRAAAAAFLMASIGFLFASPATAQSVRRTRRESTANRKARIDRTIASTYGHRFEVGGGGGFMRFEPGATLQQNNEVTFWASTLYALNPKLGIAGEVRGAYGNAKIGNNQFNLPFKPQISEYSFMAGPSYRLIKQEKFGLSGFAEGGMGLGKFAGDSKGLTAAELGLWTGDYAGAFSVGVHADYNVYPNVALRFSPNYLGTFYGGNFQHSKGFDLGLIYRFGKIK